MKKINKVVLLIGMVAITIGSTKLIKNNIMQKELKNNEISVQAYTPTPSNILDNMFVQDNMNIIPFIFANSDQTIKKETIINDFKSKGLTITNSLPDVVGTGTEIRIEQNSTVYTILIYGDVNGNGKVDLIDAQNIIMHYKNPTSKPFNKIQLLAANTYNTNEIINLTDAQRVIMLKKGTMTASLVKNEPLALVDNTPPEIRLNNGQPISGTIVIDIIAGDAYSQTITAYDAVDGDISTDIIVSGKPVDPNVVGTYTNTYTVFDRKGNKAQVTIIVNVAQKPVAQDGITVKGTPKSVQYPYKEEMKLTLDKLDLTGVTLQVTENGVTTNNVAITTDMLSTENDLTTAGTKTIKVSYPSNSNAKMKTSFEIKVLNPIDGLIIDNTNMENARKSGNDYEVDLGKTFILGEIKADDSSSTTSTLALEQLQDIAKIEGLAIRYEKIGEKILVKGEVQKAGEYDVEIKYIKAPNETKTGISFKMTAKTLNPILTNIKLESQDGHAMDSIDLALDRNSYATTVIKFLDQNDLPMELKEDSIQQITDGTTVQDGKLGIKLPKMKVIDSTGNGYQELDECAVEVRYVYKDNDTTNKIVEKIEFKLANTNKKLVNLDNIQFVIKEQGQEKEKASLVANIAYKPIADLNFTSSTTEIGKLDEVYTIRKGREYILGRIIVEQDERPLLLNEVKTELVSGDKNNINIEKAYDVATGAIVIKAILNDENQIYTIKLEMPSDNKSKIIDIQAIDVPNLDEIKIELQDKDVEIDEVSFEIGGKGLRPSLALKINGSAISDEVNNKINKVRYFNFAQSKNNYLECKTYYNNDLGKPTLTTSDDDKVEYIGLTLTDQATEGQMTITLTFFKDLPGLEITKDITVNISK